MKPAIRSRRGVRRILGVTRWLAVGLLLGLVAWVLVVNLPQLDEQPLRFVPWRLAAACALLFVHLLIMSLTWHALTRVEGVSIPAARAVAAWHGSMLGKYVPGKVLMYLGRFFIYQRAGRDGKRIALALSVETALQILAAAIVAAVCLAISPPGPLQRFRWAVWLLAACLAIAAWPPVIRFGLRLLARLLKREPVQMSSRTHHTAGLLMAYAANGFLLGLAFHLFASGLYTVGAGQYPYLTAAFLLAGLSGMLSLFAPGGIGVRDGILLLALWAVMPEGVAAAIVLATRVWTTVVEILATAVWLVFDRARKGRSTESPDGATG